MELLHEKWIAPLVESLQHMPESVISSLVSEVENLREKYSVTLEEVENQIADTERELTGMFDMLL